MKYLGSTGSSEAHCRTANMAVGKRRLIRHYCSANLGYDLPIALLKLLKILWDSDSAKEGRNRLVASRPPIAAFESTTVFLISQSTCGNECLACIRHGKLAPHNERILILPRYTLHTLREIVEWRQRVAGWILILFSWNFHAFHWR